MKFSKAQIRLRKSRRDNKDPHLWIETLKRRYSAMATANLEISRALEIDALTHGTAAVEINAETGEARRIPPQDIEAKEPDFIDPRTGKAKMVRRTELPRVHKDKP